MHHSNLRPFILGFLAIESASCQQFVLMAPSFSIDVSPTSVQQSTVNTRLASLMNTGQVRDALGLTPGTFDDKSNYRLLSANSLYSASAEGKPDSEPYVAVIADYTNRKTIVATMDSVYDPASSVSVSEIGTQAFPSWEEIADAAAIAGFNPGADLSTLMPPINEEILPDGTSNRILNFQAREKGSGAPAIRLSVNMNNRTVIQRVMPDRADGPYKCTVLRAQSDPGWDPGSGGSAAVTIYRNGEEIWKMTITRPSASRGGRFDNGQTRGSAIELRNVMYKKRKVLRTAHVPVLNVNYLAKVDGCGPAYRDWTNKEWNFGCEFESTSKAPGFQECKKRPTTILDGVEGGNFHGVAYYEEGEEVVFMSQLQAGWYRYVSEWRFAANGTIFPRFGFGGVEGAEAPFKVNCVCVPHHHHAYWRLDFDIDTPSGNTVREFNNPRIPNSDAAGYHEILMEVRRDRSTENNRHWEVVNTGRKWGYALYPGKNDGKKDQYGVGDAWFLKHNENELDDGYKGSYKELYSHAHLNQLLHPSESIKDMDVVVWYAAHFKHEEPLHDHSKAEDPEKIPHIVGPALVPITL